MKKNVLRTSQLTEPHLWEGARNRAEPGIMGFTLQSQYNKVAKLQTFHIIIHLERKDLEQDKICTFDIFLKSYIFFT